MDLKSFFGPTSIIIIIILIVVIGFIMLVRNTSVLDSVLPEPIRKMLKPSEGFIILRDNRPEDIYMNSLQILVDKIAVEIRQNMGNAISPQDIDHVRAVIFKAGSTLKPTSNEGLDKAAIELPEVINKALDLSLKDIGKALTPDLHDTIVRNIHPLIPRYLQNKPFYTLPTNVYEGKQNEYIIEGTYDRKVNNAVVKPMRINKGNIITDEINKDHAELNGKKYRGINSENLVSGIKRTGFRPHTRGMEVWDPRGQPKAMIKRVVALNSTKDPNSLLRWPKGDIKDWLRTAKGFSNQDMYEENMDPYLSKIGDPEYGTFNNIKGRFIDIGKTTEERINQNMLSNIQQDIKRDVY